MVASWRSQDPAAVRALFDNQGFYVFPQAISLAAIDAVHAYIDERICTDTRALLCHPSRRREQHRYEIAPDGRPVLCNSLLNPYLEKATSSFGRILLDLICTQEVTNLLELLDGDRQHTLHQIITFLVSPGTETHIDGWGVDTEPPGDLFTLWIPLHPITRDSGPVGLFPWARGNLLRPKDLQLGEAFHSSDPYSAYHAALCTHLDRLNVEPVVPELEPGDLLVFASTTPHKTLPRAHEGIERRAIQVLVRPSSSCWGGALPARLEGKFYQPWASFERRLNLRWYVRREPPSWQIILWRLLQAIPPFAACGEGRNASRCNRARSAPRRRSDSLAPQADFQGRESMPARSPCRVRWRRFSTMVIL
jgi:ectoine hydroxylase-related dioxygenase (phytanoyl-CoA dioxygenase family)